MLVSRCFVCQPQSHGQPHEFASRSKFTGFDPAASGQDRILPAGDMVPITGSLIHAFNLPLAMALDKRDRGECSHFAMVHDDVWPQGYWITELYRLMRAYQAVVVSAVIPLKKWPPGDTSTAIGSRADQWVTHRWIQVSDRKRMPETFGTSDVCLEDEILLVNTGCWLADLRNPCWDEFAELGGFRQEGRIIKTPNGRKSEFYPEDWLMSRFLDSRGIKYLATWAIPLGHGGWYWWTNYPEEEE